MSTTEGLTWTDRLRPDVEAGFADEVDDARRAIEITCAWATAQFAKTEAGTATVGDAIAVDALVDDAKAAIRRLDRRLSELQRHCIRQVQQAEAA